MPVTRCEGRPQRASAQQRAPGRGRRRRAHVGRAPGRERQCAASRRVLLHVALDQQRRRAPAEMPGGRRRHRARSTEKKLRPVGSTSGRPRVGAPLGPGSTNRPSSARTTEVISADRWRAGADNARSARAPRWLQSISVPARLPPTKSRAATPLDCISARTPGILASRLQCSWLWPVHGSAIEQSSGSKPARSRSAASACSSEASPPSPEPRGTLTKATSRSMSWSPAGAWPNTCRPSRICIFSSHRWLSSLPKAASGVRDRSRCPDRGRAAHSAPGSRRAGAPCAADPARRPRSTRRPVARARQGP